MGLWGYTLPRELLVIRTSEGLCCNLNDLLVTCPYHQMNYQESEVIQAYVIYFNCTLGKNTSNLNSLVKF